MIIVTGGAGFIGSAMIWKLNEENIDDILVVDNLASSEKWRNLVNRRYTDYMHRDEFRKMLDANRLPPKVEGIIHMGACSATTERNVDFLMQNNVKYSELLCRCAMEQRRDVWGRLARFFRRYQHDGAVETPECIRVFQAAFRFVGLP